MLPNQLNRVLEMSVASGEGGDGAKKNEPLGEEDKQFLSGALDSLCPDYVKVLKQCIAVIDLKGGGTTKSHEERVTAFDELMGHCDNLDIAVDFEKMGGFRILFDYIDRLPSNDNGNVKEGLLALDLLSESCQLNEKCQDRAIFWNLLARCKSVMCECLHDLSEKSRKQPVKMEEAIVSLKVTFKCLSAISSMVRGNEKSIANFFHIDNGKMTDEASTRKSLELLVSALEVGDLKLTFDDSKFDDGEKALPRRIRTKAAFLLRSLTTREESAAVGSKNISPSDIAIKVFVEIGAVQNVVGILAKSQEGSDYSQYEQALKLVAGVIDQSSPAREAISLCQRDTKEILHTRLAEWKEMAKEDDDDEMVSICANVLQSLHS